jgi:hypothetical protein
MSRKFESAYFRIKWATEQMRELKRRSYIYFNPDTHPRFKETDPETFDTLDKIKLDPMPDPIIRNVIQIIEGLRSALDHAASATAPRGKRVLFPFGDTRRDMQASLASDRYKHLPKEIKALFVSFKPYKTGNPPLWALNKICNTTKHRTIIEPGITVKDAVFEDRWGVGAHDMLPFAPYWDRRKNEIIISRSLGKGTIHHDVEFSLGIKFGKVPIFSGRPVPSSLGKMASIVLSIVRGTEAEARRIGIVR